MSNVTDERELFKNDRAAQWLNRPQPAKPTRQQHHKPERRKGKTTVIPGDGDPCPRCGVPMEITIKANFRERYLVSRRRERLSSNDANDRADHDPYNMVPPQRPKPSVPVLVKSRGRKNLDFSELG